MYSTYRDALIDVYPICNEYNKELIRNEVLFNFNRLSGLYIYMTLERHIVEYNDDVENQLIKLCEYQIQRQKINDSGFWDSPLYVVLRLKEKGIIKSLKSYQQFASKNYFFNFVCFPNKFDYNNFDVNWYSWLDLPEYSTAATINAKGILKQKFEEAISSGISYPKNSDSFLVDHSWYVIFTNNILLA